MITKKEYIISEEDYAEFILYKKEKLLNQVKALDDQYAKLFSEPVRAVPVKKNMNGRTKHGAIGWKFVIDKVISDKPLPPNDIAELVYKDLNVPRETARKSVWSTLLANSYPKKDRYLNKKEKGKKVWYLNRDGKF